MDKENKPLNKSEAEVENIPMELYLSQEREKEKAYMQGLALGLSVTGIVLATTALIISIVALMR